MSTIQLLMIIALAVQLPLIGFAFLLEFSQRKKRPPAFAAPSPITSGPEPHPSQTASREPYEQGGLPPATALEPTEALPTQIEMVSEQPEQGETASIEPAPGTPQPGVDTPSASRDEKPQRTVVPTPEPAKATPPSPPTREPVRIGLGLHKTRENFLARIRAALTGSAQVDEIYEGLEEALIGADVGVEASMKIVADVRLRLKNDVRADVIRDALKDEIATLLEAVERPIADSGDAPLVIMMAGVNGVGKTTTVAKLAAMLKSERGPLIVAASDTFRAAAIDQLQVWCDRVGVDLVRQKPGSDPAAVAFDAVKAAVARKAAAVIIDTAGRLQTKVNLMEELKKIARVVSRELKGAPHETWLVLDATTGQNALSQAKLFGETVPLTGVVLAKLDGTAKGGVVIGIAERLKLPVRYVGLGEGLEDLRPFNAREFVEGLFSEADDSGSTASGSYAA